MDFIKNNLLPLFVLLSTVTVKADHALDETIRQLGVRVAMVGVSERGKPILTHCQGRNFPEKTPVTPHTHMRIGSVTKLFVGTLVLRLQEEGKLKLDHKVSRYLDGVPNGDGITLRQLGNHTSGLPGAIYDPAFQKAIVADPSRTWKPGEILRHAFSQEPWFAPGESWRYSNTNTILLALVAEKVAGTPLPLLMQRYVLGPLGLKHTGFTPPDDLPRPHTKAFRNGKRGHPIGYGKVLFDVTRFSASWTHAAGNMYSTLHDLRKAAPALCQGSLLKAESRKELYRWQCTGEKDYRYGFCIESWQGLTGHRGDVPGYQCLIAYDAKKKKAFAILTNLSNTADGKGPANEILRSLRNR